MFFLVKTATANVLRAFRRIKLDFPDLISLAFSPFWG
jgi:hypothetical protein